MELLWLAFLGRGFPFSQPVGTFSPLTCPMILRTPLFDGVNFFRFEKASFCSWEIDFSPERSLVFLSDQTSTTSCVSPPLDSSLFTGIFSFEVSFGLVG